MSAPAISGTVALLLSANASLSIEDMEDIIQNTARPLTDSTYPAAPNMGYGYGMVDAFEAVSSIAQEQDIFQVEYWFLEKMHQKQL